MRLSVLASVLLLVAVPIGAAAQRSARGAGPTISATVGPAIIVESWAYANLSIPDTWHEGASLSLRLTTPFGGMLAAALQGIAFQAPDGRSLQSATAGLELRAGRHHQVPLNLGFGAVRQPSELLCADSCPGDSPKYGHNTRAAVAASVAYEWNPRSGLGIGPELTVTRALTDGQRYWSIHLGLRLAKGL